MKESDIRPKNLFEEYLLLSKNDAKNFDKTAFIKVRCVACGSKNVKDHIKKDGFIYQICVECNSLFCSPRPDIDTLNKFYQNSKSSKFWSEIFLPSVERDRKEKMFYPKALALADMLKKYNIEPKLLCDCGAGTGLFLDEVSKILPSTKLFAIEPSRSSVNILKNGLRFDDAYSFIR